MPGAIKEKVYKTKCGLYAKTEIFVLAVCDDVWYMNEEHIAIPCHTRKCSKCDKHLFEAYGGCRMCEVKLVDEELNYENSINKIITEEDANYREEYLEITQGYDCVNVIQKFDKAVKQYNLRRCLEYNCMNEICVITGEKRDIELVNIFYDKHLSVKQGFLVFEKWERDLKYFSTRVARDIAEKYIPIIQKEEPEKLNLRIQTRKTRSLEDDLERLRFNSNLIIEEQ